MTRHWLGAVVLVLAATACNGDDDDAVESSVPETTAAPTDAPATTGAPATTESTTTTVDATTTTVDVEALKAQIATDYLRSWELRRELTANPTLEDLDARLAQISAPGSEDYATLRTFVNELASLREHVIAGSPDLFRVDVESVELVGDPPRGAVLTVCLVRNTVRVDQAGNAVSDFGIVASRSEDHVVATPNGWLPDGDLQDVWQGLGVTECPAS